MEQLKRHGFRCFATVVWLLRLKQAIHQKDLFWFGVFLVALSNVGRITGRVCAARQKNGAGRGSGSEPLGSPGTCEGVMAQLKRGGGGT